MSFGSSPDNRNLAGYLTETNKRLRQLTDKICCLVEAINDGNAAGSTPLTQNTSAGVNTNVPAGFKSIAIIKTSSNGGALTIHLSDGSSYDLGAQFESFTDAASIGGALPAYTITANGETWKWHGIKP